MSGDEEITQSEFGRRLEMTRQRVRRFVHNGEIPTTADGKILWLEGLRSLISHLSETAAGRGGSRGVATLTAERARLAAAQADLNEHKLGVQRAEYLLKANVRDRWDTAAGLIQAHVLASVTTIAQALSHLTRHDLDAIDTAHRDALNQAADAIDALGPMETE